MSNNERTVKPKHVAKNPGSIPLPRVLIAIKQDKIKAIPETVSTIFGLLPRFENRAIALKIIATKLRPPISIQMSTVPNPSNPSS